MSDIYVPIDYSHAKELIPPGEDIVYSTLCSVRDVGFGSSTNWTSHVLMTTKGFVYTKPIGRKKPVSLVYVPWWSISGFVRKLFQTGSIKFKLIRDVNFETKTGFKQRCKEFKSKIKPISKAGVKYWHSNFPKRKERHAEINRIVELYLSKKDT